MAISYPLSLPNQTSIRSIQFTARNAVAYSRSPFTFSGQAQTAGSVNAIKQMIMKGGPVETAFTVYEDFENYAGGRVSMLNIIKKYKYPATNTYKTKKQQQQQQQIFSLFFRLR